jgi:hypothetical protein
MFAMRSTSLLHGLKVESKVRGTTQKSVRNEFLITTYSDSEIGITIGCVQNQEKQQKAELSPLKDVFCEKGGGEGRRGYRLQGTGQSKLLSF